MSERSIDFSFGSEGLFVFEIKRSVFPNCPPFSFDRGVHLGGGGSCRMTIDGFKGLGVPRGFPVVQVIVDTGEPSMMVFDYNSDESHYADTEGENVSGGSVHFDDKNSEASDRTRSEGSA